MLAWRLGVSAILIPLLIGIFYLDHHSGLSGASVLGFPAPYLLALCAGLAARGVWEMVALLRTRTFEASCGVTTVCTLAVLVAGWQELSAGLVAFALVVLVLFLKAAIRFREPGRSMETLATEMLIVAYVGVLLLVTAHLRWVAGTQAGYLALGSLVIATKSGDIGAYSLGRIFGRRKMVPRLSPGKTWVGGLGALLTSGLASVVWFQLATSQFNTNWKPCGWYWAALFGIAMGAVGLVGDLCESLVKRDVGSKDSAELLPGFGGLLDLLDSILYAGPVAYVLWNVMPLQTW